MNTNQSYQSVKKSLLKDLHTLWWDWLGCMERLILKLKEQENFLIQGDFKASEKLQIQLNQIHNKLKEIFEKIRFKIKQLCFILKCGPFIEDILASLDEKESEELTQAVTRVKTVSKNFNDQLKFNKTLIQNEMTYLAGLKMIMSSPEAKGKTRYHPSVSSPLVMDQQT